MDKLGLAIIGCGEISSQTAQAAAGVPGWRITRVMDINPEAAGDLAGRFNAKAVTALDEVLKDPETHAVYIATPHFLHAGQACEAAKAKKHVFLEKPFTIDDLDGERVLNACRTNKVQSTVMFVNRYQPAAIKARELIASGLVGKVITFHCTFMQDRREAYWRQGVSGKARPTDWRGDVEKAGGGNLVMNGSHFLDLLFFMTGLSPKRVFGEMGTYVHPVTVEDMLCATLRLKNNALGMVSIGTAARGKGSSLFTLFGDQGQIDVRDFSGRSINAFTLKTDAKHKPDKWHKVPVGPAVNPRARFMEEAAKALLAGKPLPVSGKDGVQCQRTINAIYRSAREHAPVVFE